ncbi:ubiquinol-cytochrome c reductase iron-sulfur subunit [Pseudanabaena sp. 'Roaring Creek']|uniref:QcrA and Rieske domain-containing protein n=1 Tax=Pseudanabaena sp. 'Roaring Creek' TaxID=1681830 RepID=UPI0006D7D37B|nr:Rieske 2Fe-2S domain-containing protein [Pseudanabaena sp. 'Roaring Creek']
MNLNRRKLLSWFGLGWLASLLPPSLVGCSDTKAPEASVTPVASASAAPPTSVAASPSGKFKVIGTVAQLEKDGQLISDKIAVVRDPKNAKNVLAVNITCTHKGCDVKWKSADKKFVCPCHDADFAPDGNVLEGPAKKPLQTYTAKIEKDQVLVSV